MKIESQNPAHNLATTHKMEYKVPRFLWENLESVLLAQSKRYVAELAKRLDIPEKDLMRKVLPSTDSLKVIIQDTQSESCQCKAYLQNDKLTVFCRKPVVHGTEFCALHRSKRMTVIEGTSPAEIQRVKDKTTFGPTWLAKNIMLNASGNMVGKVNKSSGKIKMFVLSA
jgi:hypothetical protein